MTGHANFILDSVDPDTAARLQPHLSLVHLREAQVLVDTHQRVQKVYFPHTGIISNVVQLSDGGSIETGMIGNDGEFGAGQAFDDKVSLNQLSFRSRVWRLSSTPVHYASWLWRCLRFVRS